MKAGRFAAALLRLAWVGVFASVVGCVTAPVRDGEMATFEFPFVHNYDVVNHTTFAWRDEWLLADSQRYHQELAGPLSALAASVYGYRLGMDVRTLVDLGFNGASLYRRYGADLDYADPVFGRDQVGFTLALKRVVLAGEPRDVLFVLVRGTYGREEWLSNLNTANTWGQVANPEAIAFPSLHEGFRKAADAVALAVELFAASNQIDRARAKVVVTGHSRGAAVANLLGARLDDGDLLAGVNRGNVFVYTFAAPNPILSGGIDQSAPRYRNIFNVINPEDIVPLVPIAKWNARRYGTDLLLHNYDELSLWEVWTDRAYNTMKDEFKDMTGYEWWHTPFGTNSTQLVPSLLGALAPTIPDLYRVPPDQRAAGNLTTYHSILETLIYRTMKPVADARDSSLGGDVRSLTKAYTKVEDGEEYEHLDDDSYFYTPNGIDYSRQPGVFDVLWRLSCMHATQTYIGWMKAADARGPAAVFQNWDSPAVRRTEDVDKIKKE